MSERAHERAGLTVHRYTYARTPKIPCVGEHQLDCFATRGPRDDTRTIVFEFLKSNRERLDVDDGDDDAAGITVHR